MSKQCQRIEWADIMKGILILFVVLSHSYPAEIYQQFFTPFFLSMFFFVSGYFFSRKDSFGAFLKSRLYQLILPLLLLGGIRMLVSYVLEGNDLILRFCGLFLQISCMYDEMWFLSCLFLAEIIFYGILFVAQRLDKKCSKFKHLQNIVILVISFVILLFGYIDICIFQIRFPWELEIACIMLFYLALGYIYRQQEKNIYIKDIWICFIGGIYLLGTLLIRNPVNIHEEKFTMPICFFIFSLLAIPVMLKISKKLQDRAIKKLFIFLGRNTLFYFAFGGFGRIFVYAVTDKVGITDEYITPIVCVIFSVIVLAIPAKMVQKYIPWLVGQRH